VQDVGARATADGVVARAAEHLSPGSGPLVSSILSESLSAILKTVIVLVLNTVGNAPGAPPAIGTRPLTLITPSRSRR